MWIWLLASVAVAGDIEIVVSSGGGLNVRATDEPVYVASCRGVLWDLFDPVATVFEPAVLPACGGMKSAIRIDQEGHTFQLDAILPPLPDVGFHVVRPIVVYGLKCSENAPFPLAGCKEIKTVRGAQVAVRSRGSAVQISVSEQR